MELNNRVGEVVFLDFPYTNHQKSKVRPAVIIAKSDLDDDYIVAYVTTEIDSYGFSRYSVDLKKEDLDSNDLKFNSLIRVDKVIVADESMFARVVGKLKEGFDPYQACMHSIVESLSDEEDVLDVLEKLISLHFAKSLHV